MNIMEIVWEDGKQYIDTNEFIWTVSFGELYDECSEHITNHYKLEQISKMQFKEVIDWSKVEVDTPIWVDFKEGTYVPRHFARCDNGKIYFWSNGRTSHTSNISINIAWVYEKDTSLTKPKEV